MHSSSRLFRTRTGLVFLVLFGLASHAESAGPPPAVSFAADIHPLLTARCLRCHRGTNPASGVRLDLRSDLLGESNGRPLVVPGHSSSSRLLAVVSGAIPDKQMPPEGRGKRLSPREVALLRSWIDQGLAWDDRLLPPTAVSRHWSFTPIRRPAVPAVRRPDWLLTPIDAFLAAAHDEKGLVPVPEAPRRVLIRRLYLDLIGLPPTPEEVDAFVADPAPDAWERLTDQLLASPAYGERWGRHWLDLARWAESEGYESNHLRPHAWHYRDYVVESFNRDRPFAEFVRQQIAGDELLPCTDENLIATGFLGAARLSSNEEDKVRQRNDVLVDVVNTTGATFLGLTMQCAQCHNHKFDPITARDYYRLMGFFIRGQPANLVLSDPVERARYEAARPAEYEPARRLRDALLEAARARLAEQARRALSPAARRALEVPADKRSPAEEELALQADLSFQFGPNQIEKAILPEDRALFEELKKKLAVIEKTLPEQPQTFGFYSPATSPTPLEVLPMPGFYPLPFEPDFLRTLRARLFVGGDTARRGPAVDPGWPAVLGPTPPGTLTRRALADWLTDPAHPLTARVYVNRLWQYHFGRGLVATPNDFGVKGSPPSHPELLDWLASEFLRSGGSSKHLHRLIVRSRAYRLSSSVRGDNERLDPGNVHLWRWRPRRLEAEAIRDTLLAVAGDLDRHPGRMSDKDELKSQRRGLYLFQKREQPPALQGVFDGPSTAAESCPLRSAATVPLQALYLFNNEFGVARARSLARRVEALAGQERERQVDQVFRLVLQRGPDAVERAAGLRFFRVLGDSPRSLEQLCHVLLNTNEAIYLE
jgi:hypothetical protein